MIKIAILASGSGSNAEEIHNYLLNNKSIKVESIISNKSEAYVHTRAKRLNIESVTFSKMEFEESTQILDYLNRKEIDFIVLAGFLLKISDKIVRAYPNKIINIHPALLPKYGGKGMYGDRVHRTVVDAKENETGITIHYVNENYDEGNIIFQAKCKIQEDDTYIEVANKVHKLEYKWYPQIITKLLTELYTI